jgi:hypothetical protein
VTRRLASHALASRGRPEGEPALDKPFGLRKGVFERLALNVPGHDRTDMPVHDGVPGVAQLDRDDAMAAVNPGHSQHALAVASHGKKRRAGRRVAASVLFTL